MYHYLHALFGKQGNGIAYILSLLSLHILHAVIRGVDVSSMKFIIKLSRSIFMFYVSTASILGCHRGTGGMLIQPTERDHNLEGETNNYNYMFSL